MYSLAGKDFLSLKDIDRSDMELVFEIANKMDQVLKARTRVDILKDKILGLMFFQVSTRTRISFESAMQRLGGGVVGFVDPKTTRAGDYYAESLHDTVKMMESYADVLVIRHPEEFSPKHASEFTDVPIINAGDGYNEHPTQAMLDVYTILRERGHLDNLCVGLVGNMNLRAIHSLALGLARFQAKVYFVSPPDAAMPDIWVEEYKRMGLNYETATSLNDVIQDVDVIYPVATSHPDYHVGHTADKGERIATPKEFIVDREKIDRAKPSLIVLHSLPRTDELPVDVDPHNSARYFIQAHYGVANRMALLSLILGKAP
jgi:aspartate carbamoyltransferase catalytic subunit